MKIIPTLRCSNLKASLDFYVRILGFKISGITSSPDQNQHFCILTLEDQELHLSTHSGDGVFGTAVYVLVNEVDELFKSFVSRGLDISKKKNSPVHCGPVNQTWGMREFYVDDPDGNTLRFGKYIETS